MMRVNDNSIYLYLTSVPTVFRASISKQCRKTLCHRKHKMVSLLKNYVKKYSEENVLSFNDVEIIQSSSCVLQDEW